MIHETLKLYDETFVSSYKSPSPSAVHYFPRKSTEKETKDLLALISTAQDNGFLAGSKVRVISSGFQGKISYLVTHPDALIWAAGKPCFIRVIGLPTTPSTECYHPDDLELVL